MTEALKCESLVQYCTTAVSVTGTLRADKVEGRPCAHGGRFALWYHEPVSSCHIVTSRPDLSSSSGSNSVPTGTIPQGTTTQSKQKCSHRILNLNSIPRYICPSCASRRFDVTGDTTSPHIHGLSLTPPWGSVCQDVELVYGCKPAQHLQSVRGSIPLATCAGPPRISLPHDHTRYPLRCIKRLIQLLPPCL